MNAPARMARTASSNASEERRGERRAPRRPAAPSRPQLHLVATAVGTGATVHGFGRLMTWVRSRNTSMIHIIVALAFLVATLLGSLVLRTRMIENSFEASSVETHIARLNQDIEEAQTKLDALETSLPSKAEEMGMTMQQGSLSIDLSGYAAAHADSGEDSR